MIQVRKRLVNLVFFHVFFPLFLLLAWVNYSHYRSLQEESDRALRGLAQAADAAVSSAIRAAGAAVESLAEQRVHPATLIARSDGLRHLRSDPAALPPADPLQAFATTRARHPELAELVLIDNLGKPVASSTDSTEPDYSGTDWYRQLFTNPDTEILFLGMASNDTFRVAVPVWERDRVPAEKVGILLATVRLAEVMDRLDRSFVPPQQGFAVLVPNKWHLAPGEGVKDEELSALTGYLRNRNAAQGRYAGMNFRVAPLGKAIGFTTRPLLVVMDRTVGSAASNNTRLVAGLGLSLFALFAITGLANRSAGRITRETQDLVEAGTWLLHQVRGEEKVPSHLIAGFARKPVYDEILGWQAGYKQSIADDIEAYAFENKRDLFLARDFQMAYMARPFPPVPAMPLPGRLRLKFSHRYKPALAIGGDFFEILSLTPETGGVFIADVMGHGTRSALITSILRVIIADSKPQGGNARNFLREMNRKFSEILNSISMDIPLFASAFYFVADCTARVATFSTAGHPAPFHLRRQSNMLEPLKVSEPHGPALGISLDEDYTGGSCRLMQGDTFIFFTDGVYECFNPRGEEFGLQNLEKTIRRLMHRSADEILQGIMDALSDFSGGTILHDDICLLAVEIEEDLPVVAARAGGTAAG